jgi:hypothetical protein
LNPFLSRAFALPGFQILDCSCAAKIEGILPRADVSGSPSLPSGNVCEPMLDAGPLAQLGAARRSGSLFS